VVNESCKIEDSTCVLASWCRSSFYLFSLESGAGAGVWYTKEAATECRKVIIVLVYRNPGTQSGRLRRKRVGGEEKSQKWHVTSSISGFFRPGSDCVRTMIAICKPQAHSQVISAENSGRNEDGFQVSPKIIYTSPDPSGQVPLPMLPSLPLVRSPKK
jgi:hypothetical protein